MSEELKNNVKYCINIHDLEDFPNLDFINDLIEQLNKELEEVYINFLKSHGYKIESPYTIDQLEKIKGELANDDKFLDCIEYTEFSDNCSQAYHYILPFFNCISNPYTDEEKHHLLELYKEFNRKDK